MKMTWNKFWTKKVKEIIIVILKQITEDITVLQKDEKKELNEIKNLFKKYKRNCWNI